MKAVKQVEVRNGVERQTVAIESKQWGVRLYIEVARDLHQLLTDYYCGSLPMGGQQRPNQLMRLSETTRHGNRLCDHRLPNAPADHYENGEVTVFMHDAKVWFRVTDKEAKDLLNELEHAVG